MSDRIAFKILFPVDVDYLSVISKPAELVAKTRGCKLFVKQEGEFFTFFEVPWDFKNNIAKVSK